MLGRRDWLLGCKVLIGLVCGRTYECCKCFVWLNCERFFGVCCRVCMWQLALRFVVAVPRFFAGHGPCAPM